MGILLSDSVQEIFIFVFDTLGPFKILTHGVT